MWVSIGERYRTRQAGFTSYDRRDGPTQLALKRFLRRTRVHSLAENEDVFTRTSPTGCDLETGFPSSLHSAVLIEFARFPHDVLTTTHTHLQQAPTYLEPRRPTRGRNLPNELMIKGDIEPTS